MSNLGYVDYVGESVNYYPLNYSTGFTNPYPVKTPNNPTVMISDNVCNMFPSKVIRYLSGKCIKAKINALTTTTIPTLFYNAIY
jgi:hypothetical protein